MKFTIMEQVSDKYETLLTRSRVTNQNVNRLFPIHQLARKVENARKYMMDVATLKACGR